MLNQARARIPVYQLGMAANRANMTGTSLTRRICKPERTACASFRVASPRADTTTLAKTEVTITANQLVRITFPAMDDQRTRRLGCVRYDLHQRRHSGPWYLYGTITTAQVSSAGGNVDINGMTPMSAQTNSLSFDSDPPPDAQYLASLAGLPVLIS